MDNQKLVINGVFRSSSKDRLAQAWHKRTDNALAALPDVLSKTDRLETPLLPFSPLGVEKLRLLWQAMLGQSVVVPTIEWDGKKILPPSETIFKAEKEYKGAHYDHFRNFFDAIRTGGTVAEDPEFGFRASAPALLCNDSYFGNKYMKWDPVEMNLVK